MIQLAQERRANCEFSVSRRSIRVYFWRRGHAVDEATAENTGYASYEHEVLGVADVNEVISWAEENAGEDRTFTIYAVVEREGEVGLVRVLGSDPTRGDQLDARR
jgi:hypothetical protein